MSIKQKVLINVKNAMNKIMTNIIINYCCYSEQSSTTYIAYTIRRVQNIMLL